MLALLNLTVFSYFRLKSLWITIKNHLDSLVAFIFMLEGVETVQAVAVDAERAHREAITVPRF
jgi:hypothetical protein